MSLLATGAIMFVDLGLRPLVKWLKRKTKAGVPLEQEYKLSLTCAEKSVGKVRAVAIQSLSQRGVRLLGFDMTKSDGDATLEIMVAVNDLLEGTIDQVISPLLMDNRIGALNWDAVADS